MYDNHDLYFTNVNTEYWMGVILRFALYLGKNLC